MAFNNTRTILLHGPRGMEWYCPTPARPPWETDKRHPMEQFRDRQFGAMPFPYSQPTILGALATPGWQTRWTWSYIEAQDNPGLTRHFVRRAPDGHLLVPEALVGHTYRILVNAENGVLPATPDADFPEPTPSRSLMSLHCHTKYNEKGEAVDYYYLAYKLPTGAPELPPKVAATKHALQKRDRSWCLLPKTETRVPESWQPIKKQIKNVAQKPVLEVLAEEPALRYEPKGPSAVLKDVLKGSATVVKDVLKGSASVLTNALDTCAKGATKVMETCRSAFTTEPEEKTPAPPYQKVQQKLETIAPISNYGNSGNPGNSGSSGNSPNYPITKSPNYPILDDPYALIYYHMSCSHAQRTILALSFLHT